MRNYKRRSLHAGVLNMSKILCYFVVYIFLHVILEMLCFVFVIFITYILKLLFLIYLYLIHHVSQEQTSK